MTKKKQKKIKLNQAHKYFSASCFNKTWDYIDMSERTAEQEEEMLRVALASHWHWTQRKDYGPVSASIANWQVSRVFALLGQAANAHRYGLRSLEAVETEEEADFYRGFAYEALARAEVVAGNSESAAGFLEKGREAALLVSDEEAKGMLLSDLDSIQT